MSDDNYGISSEFNYYEIELDSRDAKNSLKSGFAPTDWPSFELAFALQNVSAIKLLEVQVPFSYFVFNSTNNTFLLTDDVVTDAVVTIPEGNYSSNTLSTALESALITASTGVSTYTVSHSGQADIPQTNKFSIVRTNSTQFTLTFGNSDDLGVTNPRFFLGMDPGANTSSVGGLLVGPNVANITGPNYIYVNSKQFGTILTTVLPAGAQSLGEGTAGPQISKIPVNIQPGGVIYWQDPTPQYWFNLENLRYFKNFDIYLTLGNSAPEEALRLNGASFSIKLGVLVRRQIHSVETGPTGNLERQTVMGKRRR